MTAEIKRLKLLQEEICKAYDKGIMSSDEASYRVQEVNKDLKNEFEKA